MQNYTSRILKHMQPIRFNDQQMLRQIMQIDSNGSFKKQVYLQMLGLITGMKS